MKTGEVSLTTYTHDDHRDMAFYVPQRSPGSGVHESDIQSLTEPVLYSSTHHKHSRLTRPSLDGYDQA